MARTYGETLELVGKLAAAGLTDVEIGKAIDLAPASVKEVRDLVGKAIGLLDGSVAEGAAAMASVEGGRPKADKGPRRNLTEAMVARLAKAGRPDKEIAGILGLSELTVRSYRYASGIRGRVKEVSSKIAQAAEMAARGASDEEIAKLLEISVETAGVFRSWAGKRGLPAEGAAAPKTGGRRSFSRRRAVLDLHGRGFGVDESAIRLGISAKTVAKHLAAETDQDGIGKPDAGRPRSGRTQAETLALVSKLACEGRSDAEIAAELGLSTKSMRQYRHLAGAVDKERHLGAAKIAEIPVLAGKGLTDREIAARLGCSAWTVGNHRRKAGVPGNRRTGMSRSIVARLSKSGKGDAEIAEILGLSKTTVRNHRLEAGIVKRRLTPVKGRPAEALALVAKGLTDRETAARLGLAVSTVTAYRSKAGIKPGRTKAPTAGSRNGLPRKVAKVMEMAARGLSDAEIGKLLDVSPKTVGVYRSLGKRA